MSARDELAARQAALVAALVGGAGVPAGLDAGRVRIQAAALLRKRGRLVALAAPELAAALGTGFAPAFAAYATGRPARGGSADDAAEFARHLLAGSPYARDRAVRRAARRAARRSLSLRIPENRPLFTSSCQAEFPEAGECLADVVLGEQAALALVPSADEFGQDRSAVATSCRWSIYSRASSAAPGMSVIGLSFSACSSIQLIILNVSDQSRTDLNG